MIKPRLERYSLIIFILLVCIPYTLSENQSKKMETSIVRNTEIDISNIQLIYEIDPTGEYYCYFILEALGNNFTASGYAQCRFNVSDPNVEEFLLAISDEIVKVSQTKINNCTLITFSIYDQYIPVGHSFTIRGSFHGKSTCNDSSIFQYSLGIDWGTVAGSQHTKIKIDRQKFTILLVDPVPHFSEEIRLGIEELQWNEILLGRFNVNLKLQRRQTQEPFLIIDRQSWNASIGQTITISLLNNASFITHGRIYTPNWITKNVSIFEISPNQSIKISLKINSIASLGMNDSIIILILELRNPILIPVKVVNSAPDTGLASSILVIFAIIGILAISLGYYNRDTLMKYFTQNKIQEGALAKKNPHTSQSVSTQNNRITEITNQTWETVQMRWESILPEQELQVLKILLNQGTVNQKTIAEQLEVSEMTMSRIISRLETKRLLVRERFGISNLIKLNKKKL